MSKHIEKQAAPEAAIKMPATEKIGFYLVSGGLFNPELADHKKVRDLLIECRDAIAKRDAALLEAVAALDASAKIVRNIGLGLTTLNQQERDPESGLNQIRAAITKAKKALEE